MSVGGGGGAVTILCKVIQGSSYQWPEGREGASFVYILGITRVK